jgi:ribosome-associated protein
MPRRPKRSARTSRKPAQGARTKHPARARTKSQVSAGPSSLAPRRDGIASTRESVGVLDDAAALALARQCRDAALSKKGEEVVMLDIRKLANFADYFVLATGRSLIQARAIADAVVEACEDDFGSPIRTEGYSEGGWILVDYGPVIVHVFLPQTREFYNLERLWGKPAAAAKRAL